MMFPILMATGRLKGKGGGSEWPYDLAIIVVLCAFVIFLLCTCCAISVAGSTVIFRLASAA